MPIRGNTFIKGDLFIKFEVAFPLPGSISEASVLVGFNPFSQKHEKVYWREQTSKLFCVFPFTPRH